MNRTLRRPMFRMGGTAEGITSGLAPRQGYAHEPGHVTQGDTSKMSIMDRLKFEKSIVETLAPRQPRQDRSMSNFLIDFGLDIASRPPSGGIFSTAAAAAKDPFARFQQAKQMQDAYAMSETSEDRALIASLIKGMDEDELSAMMKRVKAGVSAGYYTDDNEGIIRELRVREQGVQDAPGEARAKRIKEIEDDIKSADPDEWGVARKVAEHKYKIENGEYPKDIEESLNQTKFYVKDKHIVQGSKERNEDGEVTSFLVDAMYDYSYTHEQIYFEPQTGDLFQRVGKSGEEIKFVKVIPDKIVSE